MTLYTMANEFLELFNSLEAISSMEFTPDGKGGFTDDDGNTVDPAAIRCEMEQSWFDTLEGMEGEFELKAENVAVYIKQLESESRMLELEKKALDKRIKAKDHCVERLKDYLKTCLELTKRSKIEMPHAVISIKDNPPSLQFTDECLFIGWAENHDRDDLLKYSDPTPRKDVIKKKIKSGENIPYTELVQKKGITIK